MAEAPTPGEGDGVPAFFQRCGLPPHTRYRCQALGRRLLPGLRIDEVSPQGYCSYTLSAGPDRILQFRPPAHRLDMALAEAARAVYGDLAPETRLLAVLRPCCPGSSPSSSSAAAAAAVTTTACDGTSEDEDAPPADEGVSMIGDDHDCNPGVSLDVISMTRVRGVSLAELRASSARGCGGGGGGCGGGASTRRQQREALVGHFAEFVAAGWHRRPRASDPALAPPRARGKVGGSIRWRLEQMGGRLPPRLRPLARGTLRRLDEVAALPWVLTHGDVVPSNVMVRPARDPPGGDVALAGLLDWAEAEYLPFGVGLYGLEELLGETDAGGLFSYYPEAQELCRLFWTRLAAEMRDVDLGPGSYFRDLVGISHILGVLLWHGIAFDNGKLDRVVEEGRDEGEIRRLDLFMNSRLMMTGHAMPADKWRLTWVHNQAVFDPWVWVRSVPLQCASVKDTSCA